MCTTLVSFSSKYKPKVGGQITLLSPLAQILGGRVPHPPVIYATGWSSKSSSSSHSGLVWHAFCCLLIMLYSIICRHSYHQVFIFFCLFFVEYRVHGINKQLELLIERTAAKEIGQNVDAAKPES